MVNGLNVAIPKIFADSIDTFLSNPQNYLRSLVFLAVVTFIVFVASSIQATFQTYLSEKIGFDLRKRLIDKISTQDFSYIARVTSEKLLTNLTSDVDNIKQVIALGLVQIFSSVILIVGASVMLVAINPGLGLIVLSIIPLIILIFILIFSRISQYFKKAQENIDRLNKTINESIVASPLIRILNSQVIESQKFHQVNVTTREIGMSILRLFTSLIPLINIIANLSIVVVLYFGGRSIVNGSFTVGAFSAFLNYISMIIFPILILGFISNLMARAGASYSRLVPILNTADNPHPGSRCDAIRGKVTFSNVSLKLGNKQILKDISFSIPAGKRVAILGPTAAGKTQIFYLLSGLLECSSGEILIDDRPQAEFSRECLAGQIGLVFQDSSIFNTSIRENIDFKNTGDTLSLEKAISSAELSNFIDNLPDGLDTKVAERGASLSGGQKQRLTLARALIINPKIILLDDFTARVDRETEKKIFDNLKQNYPHTTQILITQQIASVKDFDKIILIEDGEVLAMGKHKDLLKESPEYLQIYNSQLSTDR